MPAMPQKALLRIGAPCGMLSSRVSVLSLISSVCLLSKRCFRSCCVSHFPFLWRSLHCFGPLLEWFRPGAGACSTRSKFVLSHCPPHAHFLRIFSQFFWNRRDGFGENARVEGNETIRTLTW